MSRKADPKRYQRVLDAIAALSASRGVPPTLDELGAHLGITKQSVYSSLKRLRAQGRVVWEEHEARTLRLVGADLGVESRLNKRIDVLEKRIKELS